MCFFLEFLCFSSKGTEREQEPGVLLGAGLKVT